MLLANPGNARHVVKGSAARSILGDLSTTPSDTKVVLVAGDEDKLVTDKTALEILGGLCHIPRNQRDLLIFHSDHNEAWAVTAGHGAPGAPDPRYDFGDDGAKVVGSIGPGEWPAKSKSMNNLDIYGYWKLLDSLVDATIHGSSPDAALGGGRRQRFMGLWPDGKPLKEATVADDPCVPAVL